MSDDILVMILSLLPIKVAVVTSSLSTRWRFVWCYLTQLYFDGGETLRKIANDRTLRDSECSTYINQKSLKLDSIPELPSVKKLRLKMGGCKYKCLVYLASILNACPNLVTLTLEQDWTSPTINMTKAKDVTNPNEHLKIVKIVGYYGRICDVKLIKYIVHTAVALKKIVIDPCGDREWASVRARNCLRNKEAARCQLASVLPQDVDLCIL
nr:hypothetical protein [Tanacetum cinerariifolium]